MRTVGDWCIDAVLLVSAIVHLTPAVGIIGSEALQRLLGAARAAKQAGNLQACEAAMTSPAPATTTPAPAPVTPPAENGGSNN